MPLRRFFTPLLTPWIAPLLLGLGCAAPGAHAERADRSKPIILEADRNEIQDGKEAGVATLNGNVVLTQGSRQLRAERVVVRRDAQEHITATASGGEGGLAHFRQRRDQPGETMEGQAATIVYDSRQEVTRFNGRVVMRSFVNGALSSELVAEQVLYDARRDRYTIEGDTPRPVGSVTTAAEGTGRRARMMIVPRSAEADAVAPGDDASASPSGAPSAGAPRLKPSHRPSPLPYAPHPGQPGPEAKP